MGRPGAAGKAPGRRAHHPFLSDPAVSVLVSRFLGEDCRS
jgi:hypothetical protein